MGLREAMGHLFKGGYHFGRYRAQQCSSLGRWFWVAASPAVPPVLLGRIVRRVASRQPKRLWHLLRGIGYLILLLLAWSVGEAGGYLSRYRSPPSRIQEQ